MKKFILILITIVLSISFAQNVVIDTQSIVVNPKPSFIAEVWVNKDPSGQALPKYKIGENIVIGIRVNEAAFVYLFDVRYNGEINQILPNRFDQEGKTNYLNAGQVKYFPAQNASYSFKVEGPLGIDKLIVLASKESLDVSSLASYSNNPNFATAAMNQDEFARTLSIVVQPKPQHSWVTDTVAFEVADNVPTRAGSLDLRSAPSGAEAYVNGKLIGRTPVSINTKAGNYQVELKLANYKSFSQIVEVTAGQTTTVSVNLESDRQTASLNIGSSPSGAEVYVDGQFVGNSPIAVNVTEANHSIELRLAGYISYSRNIYTELGQTAIINPVLEVDNHGQAYFNSEPAGADIYVNGSYLGQTPFGPVSLKKGDYSATMSFAGYPDENLSFRVIKGQEVAVSVQFSNLNTTQTYLDDYTGISLFPGAKIIYEEPNKHGNYVEFNVNSSLEIIMEDLNSQLFLKGWKRVRNNPKHNRIEVKYELNGVELYIELKKTGSKEFSLDIYY